MVLGTAELLIWHTGGTFGCSSYILLLPGKHKGIILMANESDPNTQIKLIGMAKQIMGIKQ
jgi:D-alanyl-D-alanine-carboxypeptidase/D-alanyl-D-alanine-endopeptidase